MIFCSSCGKEIGNDSSFCNSCGVSTSQPIAQPASGLIVGGWVALVLGLIGFVYPFSIVHASSNETQAGLIVVMILSVLITLLSPTMLGWGYKNRAVLWIAFGISLWLFFPLAILPFVLVRKLPKK